MPGLKISQLPAITGSSIGAPQLTDIFPEVQPPTTGVTYQTTFQQLLNLYQPNIALTFPGNPSGSVAGTTYQLLWDTLDSILYICTTTGNAASAVWTPAGSLPIPVLVSEGGTGVTSVTVAPTATAFAGWDTNKNFSAVGFITGYTTTATAGSTTTLTVGSNQNQYFTGTSNQSLVMPVANTLVVGQSWNVINNSSGVVTIKSSGGNTILALVASSETTVTCILASGTSAASWTTSPAVSGSGTVNSGLINELAWYAANGMEVSGLATADNGVLVTSGSGIPSISSTLPGGLTIPLPLISGVTNGGNASAGNIGEFISSVIASGSAVSLSNSVAKDVTSISLTAGDWDLHGNVTISGSAENLSAGVVWISSSSASQPDTSLLSVISTTSTAITVANAIGLTAPYVRASLSSTTTYYLSCNSGFGSGSASACGGIFARRVR